MGTKEPGDLDDMLRRGPFINDDGDIWVPATMGIAQAKHIAREAVYDGRLHFEGMEDSQMSMHEWDDGECDGSCKFIQPCTWRGRTYHFREVE